MQRKTYRPLLLGKSQWAMASLLSEKCVECTIS